MPSSPLEGNKVPGRGCGEGGGGMDLDLEAALKAHRTAGVEHDGVPDDTACRLAMPCGVEGLWCEGGGGGCGVLDGGGVVVCVGGGGVGGRVVV